MGNQRTHTEAYRKKRQRHREKKENARLRRLAKKQKRHALVLSGEYFKRRYFDTEGDWE